MYDGKLTYWSGFEDKIEVDPHTGQPAGWVYCTYSLFVDGKFVSGNERFDQTKLRLLSIDTGWYNLPIDYQRIGMAVLIQRRAARQNYKGLSHKTHLGDSAFSGVHSWRGRYALHQSQIWEHGVVIEALLNPTYYSLDHAMDIVGDKRSVALNKDFAIVVSHIAKYRVLLLSRFGSYIGAIDGRNIAVYHPGSKQEVYDFVKRTKANYQVNDAVIDSDLLSKSGSTAGSAAAKPASASVVGAGNSNTE